MMTTTVQPRVYVACLAAYNAGVLHGRPRLSLPHEQINRPPCATGQLTGKTA